MCISTDDATTNLPVHFDWYPGRVDVVPREFGKKKARKPGNLPVRQGPASHQVVPHESMTSVNPMGGDGGQAMDVGQRPTFVQV